MADQEKDQKIAAAPVSEPQKRAKEAEEAKKAQAAAEKKAAEDAKKQQSESVPSGTRYFRSDSAAGLAVLKEDGESVRFTPRFDTYKGDRVKVGFLATDDKEVIKRLEEDVSVVEIKEKEYKDSEELDLVPVYSV